MRRISPPLQNRKSMEKLFGILLLASALLGSYCQYELVSDENTTQRCSVARRADWHLYIMVLVPVRETTHPFSKVKVELAVERSIRHNILSWYRGTVSTTFVESDCESHDGVLEAYFAANMQRMADVFIGPVCNILNEFAQFASMWNLPVLAPGGSLIDNPNEPEIQPRNRYLAYDTVTLLANFHFEEVSRFLFSLFQQNDWHKFLFLDDPNSFAWVEPHYCSSMFAAMNNLANERNNDSVHVDLVQQLFSTNSDVFDLLRNQYGIVVLCAESHHVRNFMLAAQEAGFTDSGEYVFVVLVLHSSEQRIREPWFIADDPLNDKARLAYRPVIMISALQNATGTYQELMSATIDHVTDVTGVRPSPIDVDRMWQFVGSFYDALALFGSSYRIWYEDQPVEPTQRTMRPAPGRPARGFGVGYGREVTKQLRDRVFDGISGPLRIDSNGHKITEYRALSLNPEATEFKTVMLFAADCVNRTKPTLVHVPGNHFFWHPEPPPNDTPLCGRIKCLDPHVPDWLIALCVIISVVLASAAVGFYYLNRKAAARMGAISWRVNWSDLELVQPSRMLGAVVTSSVASVRGLWADPTAATINDNSQSTFSRPAAAVTTAKQSVSTPTSTPSPVTVSNKVSIIRGELSKSTLSGSDSKRRLTEGRSKSKMAKAAAKARVTHTALYKGTFVHLQPIPECDANPSIEIVREIRALKETTHYEHLCQLIGVCTDAPNWCIVTEYCPRGRLRDLLDNHSFVMDVTLKFSLIVDLARALDYLHARYGPHGRLTTANCLIDARFALKVTDFGLVGLRKGSGRPVSSRALLFARHTSDAGRHAVGKDDEDNYFNFSVAQSDADVGCHKHELASRRFLYRSPELLRASKDTESLFNTPATDAYSFAVIAHEIGYRKGPFWNAHNSFTYSEVLKRVVCREGVPYRPTLDVASLDAVLHDTAMANELVRLVGACWQEEPSARPTLASVSVSLRGLHRGASNLLDNLLSRMEVYTNNLESLVASRTQDYLVEKQKVEQTLFTLLPRSIASQLVAGRSASAEAFDGVSIYFSDIAGFTAMSSQSSPIQVVNFLNDLYVAFDTCIGNFDAYKVETIGDAYMVVSGLPERNGNLHAREIARIALSLLQRARNFRIAHRPNDPLRIRIGIHAGSVCAGVVGVKMPRYCLFGDTVNVAKLMEGTGEAMRVQASDDIKKILDSFGSFDFEYRGEVPGHNGSVTTWWLLGERDVVEHPAPITVSDTVAASSTLPILTDSSGATVTTVEIEREPTSGPVPSREHDC